MPTVLDRLAGGSQTTLLGGLAGVFNQFQTTRREQAASQQQADFKQQQLDVSQGRLDLQKLQNEQANTQQGIANTLAGKQFDKQQEVRDQQILTQKTTQQLGEANLAAKDLSTLMSKGKNSGIVARSLLQTFPGDELQQQANYEKAKVQASRFGGQLPAQYPGQKGLEQFVQASDVVLNAGSDALKIVELQTEQKRREADKKAQNRQASQEALIKIKGNLTPNLIAAARTLEGDSADGLIKEALSAKGLGDAQAKASQFLSGIIESNELFLSMDTLVNHPGLKQFQGLTAGQLAKIPSSPAAAFANELRRFDAKKFQANLKKMTNLGALSDTEGNRLVDNLTATDAKLSPKAFLKTILDAKRQLRTGIIAKWTTDNPNIPPEVFAKLFDNPSSAERFETSFKDQLPNGWYFIKNTLFKEEKSRQDAEQPANLVAKPIGSVVKLANGEERRVGFNKRLVTSEEFRQQTRANIHQRRRQSGESAQPIIDQLRQNLEGLR